MQSFLLVCCSSVVLETNMHANRKKNGAGAGVKCLPGSSICLWPAGCQCSLGGTWRSYMKVTLPWEENAWPTPRDCFSVGTPIHTHKWAGQWESSSLGHKENLLFCLASGMTSEEISLYISKCTTLSLWEISQLQQIELFHFGLQMAFSYTSRHINLITNDHIFH